MHHTQPYVHTWQSHADQCFVSSYIHNYASELLRDMITVLSSCMIKIGFKSCKGLPTSGSRAVSLTVRVSPVKWSSVFQYYRLMDKELCIYQYQSRLPHTGRGGDLEGISNSFSPMPLHWGTSE